MCRGCMLGVDGGFVPELAGPRVDHRLSGSLTVFLFVWGFAVSKLKCSPRTATDRLALPGSTLNQDARRPGSGPSACGPVLRPLPGGGWDPGASRGGAQRAALSSEGAASYSSVLFLLTLKKITFCKQKSVH